MSDQEQVPDPEDQAEGQDSSHESNDLEEQPSDPGPKPIPGQGSKNKRKMTQMLSSGKSLDVKRNSKRLRDRVKRMLELGGILRG